MAFNYKSATDQEILDHIANSPTVTISVAKAYHIKVGNRDIVEKIDYARKLLKQRRLQSKLDSLNIELSSKD